jgi:hypothetical protein
MPTIDQVDLGLCAPRVYWVVKGAWEAPSLQTFGVVFAVSGLLRVSSRSPGPLW